MTWLPDDIKPILESLELEDDGPPLVKKIVDGGDTPGGPTPPPKRKGLYLSPRQSFIVLASVLAVVLLALIGYVVWLWLPADLSTVGGAESAGIIPERAIHGPGRGDTPRFSKPMGAAWGPDGERIYVADTKNNRVVAFDSDGKFVFETGGFGIAKPLSGSQRTWNPGELNYPTDVATDRSGNIYVADFFNDSISVFDPKGEFVRRFPDPYSVVGKGGSGQDGKGIAVTALTVQGDFVYATDEYQVFVFKTDGTYVRQFGKPGAGPGDLDHPGGIAVASSGTIYVSDSNHNRIIAFSPAGSVLWTTGDPITELRAETDNPFVLPRGLSILTDGSLLVADPLGQQLVKLDENGRVLATYGMRGSAEGQLNFPNDVDSHKELVLVADRENDRVQVVRLSSR